VKTLSAFSLAIVFAASTVGVTSAQTTPTPPPAMEKKADDKMGAKKIPSKSASGMVKSATAESIVVAGKEKGKDAEWTFSVDPSTKIRKGGKSVTAADLKAGETVHVRYHEMDGKTMAQSIAVRGGGMAKKSSGSAPAAEKPAEKK
jgi:hypothetical protein